MHNAIWDFDMYELNELHCILESIENLEMYGLFQDEDMKRELVAEIQKNEGK